MKPRFAEKTGGRARMRESDFETAAPLVPPYPTIKKLQEGGGAGLPGLPVVEDRDADGFW